jgi:hypothetical protein
VHRTARHHLEFNEPNNGQKGPTQMTDLHLSTRTEPPVFSRLAAFMTAVSEWLQVFGAATRAARAVEARRSPRPADLRMLGIAGKLPEAW